MINSRAGQKRIGTKDVTKGHALLVFGKSINLIQISWSMLMRKVYIPDQG